MKKSITVIVCAVLFSACAQAAQTETAVTTEITTEVITETAVTTASQTVTETTTEALQTETASETVISSASTTETTTEAATVTTTKTISENTTVTNTETTETVSETSTEAETTAETSVSAVVSVDEENQRILDEMPDIVFVMSYNLWKNNIYGFYVTKTGEIKMYDFRNIAPDETYEIPDIYDRLEEATCDRIVVCEDRTFNEAFGAAADGLITQDELISISQEMMIHSYKRLHISHGAGLREVPLLDNDAEYNYYGVLKEQDGYKFIRLGTWGRGLASDYDRLDNTTEELCSDVYSWFPEIPDGYIY